MGTKERNRNYYINIADWMLAFNDLTEMELMCYAVVYSFNQAQYSCYTGSCEEMSWLLGLKGKSSASEYLNALEKKGYLRKEEVKYIGKQKMCKYYVTTDWKGKVEDQNVDYITIQPWMFKKLGLRKSQLLTYARIQNLSRSKSVYYYDFEDLQKWTKCKNEKDFRRRVINELIKKKLIELSDISTTYECYKAIIPNNLNIQNNTPIKSSGKSRTPSAKPEHLTPGSGKSRTESGKSRNNNLNNLDINNNNIINNNIDYIYNTPKPVVALKRHELIQLVKGHITNELYTSVKYDIAVELDTLSSHSDNFPLSEFSDNVNKLIEIILKQNNHILELCLNLTKDQLVGLYENIQTVRDDIYHSFNNPDGWLVKKLKEALNE